MNKSYITSFANEIVKVCKNTTDVYFKEKVMWKNCYV